SLRVHCGTLQRVFEDLLADARTNLWLMSTILCLREQRSYDIQHNHNTNQRLFVRNTVQSLRDQIRSSIFRLQASLYFAMQMFLGSVKKCRASVPPSRPTPLAFMPPKGTRRSRTSQQFTQTVPVWICSATRWARLRFCVQTLDERP